MMLFLLLSVCATTILSIDIITLQPGKTFNLTQGDYIIQSPNFPNPYGFYNDTGQVTISLPTGRYTGYYLFFKEFMMGDNEYMTIYHDNKYETLSGPVFSKRGTSAYIYTESGVTLRVTSENPYDGLAHTGFQIIVQYHDAGEIIGTKYDNTTNLDTMEHAYFFVSPNYPVTAAGTIYRTQTFTSNNNIRVLLYDFNFHGTVTLTGTAANGTNVKLEYSGFETIISTVASYFIKKVSLDVTCNLSTGCGRYYIIVETYESTSLAAKTENVTLLHSMLRNFASPDYGNSAYPNNYDYYFNITAPEYGNQKIVLYIDYESEASSDVMTFSGLTANPAADDWRLTGSWHTLLFAETNNLQLSFKSDGVGRAAGFRGSLYIQTCSCPDSLTLPLGTYLIQNPGTPGRSYCPGIDCLWSYRFPVDKVLELELSSLEFRTLDYLRILDHQNNTIVVLSTSNQPKSSFFFDSGIVYFHFITSTILEAPADSILHFQILSKVMDLADAANNSTYINSMFDNVTYIKRDDFPANTSVAYQNTIKIQPPFTIYDLSTITSGLFSVYKTGDVYEVLSSVVSNGLTLYTSDVPSLTVQYFNQNSDKGNSIKLLAGPSNMFTTHGCSTPPVVTVAYGASVILNLEEQQEKCRVMVFHNSTDERNAGLMFSLDQLSNNSEVEIFMGTGPYQLTHVPVYVYGDITTLQYSGSSGAIKVNSVLPQNLTQLDSDCTPMYLTTPNFNTDVLSNVYTYEVFVPTPGNFTYQLTALSELNQALDIIVWTDLHKREMQYNHLAVNEVQKFNGTRLTLKFFDSVNQQPYSTGLYFSIAACALNATDTDSDRGSATNANFTVSILFITIWITIYNNYKSLI